jgi:hypothetical protein
MKNINKVSKDLPISLILMNYLNNFKKSYHFHKLLLIQRLDESNDVIYACKKSFYDNANLVINFPPRLKINLTY